MWEDELFKKVYIFYIAAVQTRLNSEVAQKGLCIDRRSLALVNKLLPAVERLVCFTCVQVQLHVPAWSKQYEIGQ